MEPIPTEAGTGQALHLVEGRRVEFGRVRLRRRSGAGPVRHELREVEAFKAMFREGMALVEDTAEYLDGPGRTESTKLRRTAR
jgi:hypothetical protein